MLVRTETFRKAQAGTTPGTRPAFSAAGTAYENTTLVTTHQPTYPATVNAGDKAFLVMWGESSAATSFSLHADAVTAGWTMISSSPLQTAATTKCLAVATRDCAGTEDGASMEGGITGSGNETTSHVHGCIFTVSAADGFHASPIEDVNTAEETGTTVNGPTVTPNDINRLAMSIIAFDLSAQGLDAFSGANATWTERIDITTELQTDSNIQVQTAPADAEVSGGSDTTLDDTTRLRFSFAIAPADIQ